MIQGPPPEFGRITIEEDENKTLITYRWFHLTYLSDLGLGILFVSTAYIILFLDVAPHRQLFAIIAAIIMLVLGVLWLYYSLAGVLNKTRIVVQDRKINVTSYPLPWRRDRPQEITDIVKIYNTERVSSQRNKPPRVYPILALISEGSVKTILGHAYSEVEAIYICEKLQHKLGLESKPYLEVMLNKLYEPDQKLNPSFSGTRKYQVAPSEIAQVVQATIAQRQWIFQQALENSVIRFDILDLHWGSGDYYTLTQVTIKASPDGSEVTVKQKYKPYISGSIGHKVNIRGFFKEIEFAQKFKLHQFDAHPNE